MFSLVTNFAISNSLIIHLKPIVSLQFSNSLPKAGKFFAIFHVKVCVILLSFFIFPIGHI